MIWSEWNRNSKLRERDKASASSASLARYSMFFVSGTFRLPPPRPLTALDAPVSDDHQEGTHPTGSESGRSLQALLRNKPNKPENGKQPSQITHPVPLTAKLYEPPLQVGSNDAVKKVNANSQRRRGYTATCTSHNGNSQGTVAESDVTAGGADGG